MVTERFACGTLRVTFSLHDQTVKSSAPPALSRQFLAFSLWMCCLGCSDAFDGKGTGPDGHGGDEADADADADSDADTDTDADTDASASPGSGTALCAGGGTATDGVHTAFSCLAPVEVALSTEATDGTHTLHAGPTRRVSP